jgi:hypothetical protein
MELEYHCGCKYTVVLEDDIPFVARDGGEMKLCLKHDIKVRKYDKM